jgi:hypothetical protein
LRAADETAFQGSGSGGGMLFGRAGPQAQQDSQELLQVLVETLQLEWAQAASVECQYEGTANFIKGTSAGGGPLSLAAILADDGLNAAGPLRLTQPGASILAAAAAVHLVAPCPLTGWFGTAAICLGPCKRARPVTHTAFATVPLSLAGSSDAGSGSAVRLEALLEAFTRREVMAGVNCDHCTRAARVEALQATVAFLEVSLQQRSQSSSSSNSSSGSSSASEDAAELSCELAATRRTLQRLLDQSLRGGVDRRQCDRGQRRRVARNRTASDAMDGGVAVGDDDEAAVVRRHLSRRLLFARLPHVLIFHVQRQIFNRATGAAVKLRTSIDFPDTLDMQPFAAYGGGQWQAVSETTNGREKVGSKCSAQSLEQGGNATTATAKYSDGSSATEAGGVRSEPITGRRMLSRPSSDVSSSPSFLYECCACVMHHGGTDGASGHYTTLRKLDWDHSDTRSDRSGRGGNGGNGANGYDNRNGNARKARWVHASDAQVAEVPGMDATTDGSPAVHRAEAFLLIYSRRSPVPW